jgi:hypothetical protein
LNFFLEFSCKLLSFWSEFVQWWADFGLSLSVLAAHESNQEHAESGAALNETGLEDGRRPRGGINDP